ncbi:tetratricopeptide repeat protein [Fundidesulfovibrio terrae]|uniref:tetratricopeptide repeat protein n=1 Tax=Fundidesulfovibrio terrae TaxID=2922866 RepID=UPI001FAEB64E|nr:tetratricopeptide repeat protein [Fundidesulfovibrio terrae]
MKFDPASLAVALINSDGVQQSKDRQALSKLGFGGVHVFAGVGEARKFMGEVPVQLILVGDKAGQLSGVECLKDLKRQENLKQTAVVMISSDGRREHVLKAVSAGCGGYVLRPYILATFAKHLKAAWESSRPDEKSLEQVQKGLTLAFTGQFSEAVQELGAAAGQENDALEWFNKGLEHLRKQEYGQAISCFNTALAVNALFAEAYRGLAYAHKGLGDMEKHLEFLKKSAEILAMQDKLQELKELYVEILSHDPEAVNPYNTLGVRLRRSGDLSGALHAYTRALDLTPTDENLHYNIAKAYIHAAKKDKAAEHLRKALEIKPDFVEASEMLASLEPKDTGKP